MTADISPEITALRTAFARYGRDVGLAGGTLSDVTEVASSIHEWIGAGYAEGAEQRRRQDAALDDFCACGCAACGPTPCASREWATTPARDCRRCPSNPCSVGIGMDC